MFTPSEMKLPSNIRTWSWKMWFGTRGDQRLVSEKMLPETISL